ncbi:Crp-like helix-turn-helix domain-containing protein [Alloyangia pacifica]|uniref:Crp-like helix-turn-helix domain-containing protein n=2 Tax=Alloyangia pacifica TaxID=311180 RepID=A0A1I6VGB7_9RHOB|nr:Crp-like helix-turn-helix domain-containing protein [Alloyangia pacifica]SFT12762.1 Crp-like helix-turn-helix domain-containing protein [Alloyangia pacifica]
MGEDMQTGLTSRQAEACRCRHCAARNFGFCGTLDAHALREVSSRSSLAFYPRGTEIVLQGEPLEKIGIIAGGVIKVGTVTEGGDEHLLQIMRRGQLIHVPENTGSLFTWETATDAEVCWMPRKAWDGFLEEQPSHFLSYMVTMHYQLEQMQRAAMNMRGRNTLQRLSFWLLEELANSETGAPGSLHICLSRRDLASLLDMTAETLCRSLRQLHDKRAIRLLAPDHLEVTDLTKLRLIARCHEDCLGEALARPFPSPRRNGWHTWSETAAPPGESRGHSQQDAAVRSGDALRPPRS